MCKSFQHGSRKLDVLRGVNLTLCAGEMVTIIGASGAGKSTLLHCLGTLDLPTSGQILFHPPGGAGSPTDITRLPPERRRLAMMFQSYALLPHMTALENVRFPLRMQGREGAAEQRRRAPPARQRRGPQL